MRLLFMLLLVLGSMQAFVLSKISVSGYIYDENKKPIGGVLVKVIGTNRSTYSDPKGYFSLDVNENEALALSLTMEGFKSKDVLAIPGKPISVIMTRELTKKIKPIPAESKQEAAVASKEYLLIQGNQRARQLISGPQYQYSQDAGLDREGYDHIQENGFRAVKQEPLSTFSIDVDGASYSNVRRFLNNNTLPPAGAVRVEEMINYFQYGYAQPKNGDPFAVHTEMAECPWNAKHKMLLVGLQGKKMPVENLPVSNLSFLIDVSGSMASADKLPLVKQALALLTEQLREKDMVSIVVYAGAAGIVLPPTNGTDKAKIKEALEKLEAGGSTAGGAGIKLAYQTAKQHFVKGGNNRVILCTDGDFNVGMSSDDELIRLIEKERESGVFLSILGFGTGNYQDAKMQKLADKGNGNHSYVDQISEAKKVFVNEFGGTLFTIAKDVKIQIEFNPAYVQGYRLVGYENRMLNREDFNDDKKDAGEMGSGHTVTALYEIIPAGVETNLIKSVDDLKYSDTKNIKPVHNNEALTVKLRYKDPQSDISKLMLHNVKQKDNPWKNASDQFRFAAAVAEMGMLLRESEFKGTASFNSVIALASGALGADTEGYRKEFIGLAGKASRLKRNETDLSKNE